MTPEQRQARLRHHMYETCEGIAEQSERIVKLEELCAELFDAAESFCDFMECENCKMFYVRGEKCGLNLIEDSMRELGVVFDG